jgi:hypothetical protein
VWNYGTGIANLDQELFIRIMSNELATNHLQISRGIPKGSGGAVYPYESFLSFTASNNAPTCSSVGSAKVV